jgi:hypothetical protein
MPSDADRQREHCRRCERASAGAVESAEPAEVVLEAGRGRAVEAAQPVLQSGVVAVDVIDVPGCSACWPALTLMA